MCALARPPAQPPPTETIEGTLAHRAGQTASLESAGQKPVTLTGDKSTVAVLADRRLDGMDVQAKGHFTAPDRFQIDPSHTRSLLVRKEGHLKLVTYWCELCSIRAYTPGLCACCQQETTLDLRDPSQ
jgi:hypothetical protein